MYHVTASTDTPTKHNPRAETARQDLLTFLKSLALFFTPNIISCVRTVTLVSTTQGRTSIHHKPVAVIGEDRAPRGVSLPAKTSLEEEDTVPERVARFWSFEFRSWEATTRRSLAVCVLPSCFSRRALSRYSCVRACVCVCARRLTARCPSTIPAALLFFFHH